MEMQKLIILAILIAIPAISMPILHSNAQSQENTSIVSENQSAGHIVTFPIVTEAILSHVNISLVDATNKAIDNVGNDAKALDATLRTLQGQLVYVISVVDNDMNLFRVVISPADGEIISSTERPTFVSRDLSDTNSTEGSVLTFMDQPTSSTNSTGNQTN